MAETSQVANLNALLANMYALLIQTQSVHWNFLGTNFFSIHKMTQSQYEDIFDAIDKIAERIRAKGHHVTTGISEYAKQTVIKEQDDTMLNADAMCQHLIDANKKVCELLVKGHALAEKEKDFATADMLNQRLLAHEGFIWMLSATICG